MKKVYLLLVPVLALAGCSGLASNNSPDELSVIDAAPLTLPPNFDLRPPREGEKTGTMKVQEPSLKRAEDIALDLPYEEDQKMPKTKSTGTEDAWLLEKAGSDNRDESIRLKLEVEAAPEEDNQPGWFERTFGSKDETKEVAPASEEEKPSN